MHNEPLAIEQLKALPKDAKIHLSHVLRNGLQTILGFTERRMTNEAMAAIQQLAQKMLELGL